MLFALLLLVGGNAFALQVQPMIFDMSATGPASRQVITVINTAPNPVPMELRVNRLDIGPNGETIRTEGGGEDFIIFPPQALIPANATQTFRVQWAGEPDLAESRSYNIAVSQLPVEVPSDDAGVSAQVQIVYNFLTTVTVAPANGVSVLDVLDAEAAQTPDGKRAVALTLENSGNRHGYLADAELTLDAGSWSRTLSPSEVRAFAGPGLVLPGHRRRILVPIDDLPSNPGRIAARLDFDG